MLVVFTFQAICKFYQLGITLKSATDLSLDMIYHIGTPNLPQFRFEWHPDKKTVYLIDLHSTPLIGEAIAFEVPNKGAAHNSVLIYLRGYRRAKGERWNDAGKLIERLDRPTKVIAP
jgi:hypothetical protein